MQLADAVFKLDNHCTYSLLNADAVHPLHPVSRSFVSLQAGPGGPQNLEKKNCNNTVYMVSLKWNYWNTVSSL